MWYTLAQHSIRINACVEEEWDGIYDQVQILFIPPTEEE